MRIEPAHGDHSIVEVVFQLELDSPLEPADLERLESLVPELRDDLPAYRRLEPGPVADPSGVVFWGQPRSLAGVEFAAIRRNGAYEWRVQCLPQTITVNCLAYTRWKRVATAVRTYLGRISSVTSPRRIRAVTLQFIDEFTLVSDGERVDWELLFALDSPFLPRWFGSRGRIWHLHQGWLVDEPESPPGSADKPLEGQLLERLHMDSLLRPLPGRPDGEHVVRIDHLQRAVCKQPVVTTEHSANGDTLFEMFEVLHRRNKDVLRRLLNETVQKRISLHGTN